MPLEYRKLAIDVFLLINEANQERAFFYVYERVRSCRNLSTDPGYISRVWSARVSGLLRVPVAAITFKIFFSFFFFFFFFLSFSVSIVGFIFVNSTRETRENQNDNGICPIDRRARRCIDRFDGGLKLLARIRAKDYRQYYRQGQTADPQSLDCISVWNRSFKLAKLRVEWKISREFSWFFFFSFPLFRFSFFFFIHVFAFWVWKKRLVKSKRESSVTRAQEEASCLGLGKSSRVRFKKKRSNEVDISSMSRRHSRDNSSLAFHSRIALTGGIRENRTANSCRIIGIEIEVLPAEW